MYEDLKTGIIDIDEYKLFKEKYKDEKDKIQARLVILDNKISEYNSSESTFIEVGKLYEKYTSVKEITLDILNSFVEKIFVGEYDKENNIRDIKIKWKYQF